MTTPHQDTHPRDVGPALPTREDFDPFGSCLDAQWAWKNFGGLTLAEADAKFREKPEIFQEDFMFMGGRAFAFYFPVIERHLREAPAGENGGDDREAWILAHGIRNQLRQTAARHVLPLANRILALARFVRENIARFGYDEEERARVDAAWRELEEAVRAAQRKRFRQETGARRSGDRLRRRRRGG